MTNLTNVEIQEQLERLGYRDSREIEKDMKDYGSYVKTKFNQYCKPIAPNTVSLKGKNIEDFIPIPL